MFEALSPYFQIFLTFHVLGTVFGLGGATIADILFFKFLADYRISQKEADVLGTIKNVIFGSLVVIIITGLGMYLPNMATYNVSAPFLLKTGIVGVICINGWLLHEYIAPYLIHLNLRDHKTMPRLWHRFAFALGGVSVCSWYSVFFIAMLKNTITFTGAQLLGLYVMVLMCTITATQVLEHILTKRAHK